MLSTDPNQANEDRTDHGALTIDTRRVRTLDGARVAYRILSRANRDAPRIVLAAPLGLPSRVFQPLCDHFSDRFELLTWDYRGLFESGPPLRGTTKPFGVTRQSSDLLAILQAEGWDRVCVVGWGFGAQVALDFARVASERVRGLILLCGGPRGSGGVRGELDARGARLLGRLARSETMRPRAARWLKRLGWIGRELDDAIVIDLAQRYAEQPLDVLRATAEGAREHDIEAALATIRAPSLVVAGDRDRLVPKAAAQQMARALPSAEILVVHGGSHLAPIEYPELVHLRMEQFFAENGLA